jgi:hypothetical protein
VADVMTMTYVLDAAGNVVPEPDGLKWGQWFASANRAVGMDIIGDARVSTVFLGVDHSFGGDGSPPVLWETMIFGGEHDGYQERYTSAADAINGHRRAMELVKKPI